MGVRQMFTVDLQPPKLRLEQGRGRRVKHCNGDLVMFTRTREVFGGSENVGNAEARPGQSQPIQGLMSPPQTLRRGKEGCVGWRIEDTDESVISHTSHMMRVRYRRAWLPCHHSRFLKADEGKRWRTAQIGNRQRRLLE